MPLRGVSPLRPICATPDPALYFRPNYAQCIRLPGHCALAVDPEEIRKTCADTPQRKTDCGSWRIRRLPPETLAVSNIFAFFAEAAPIPPERSAILWSNYSSQSRW